MKIIGFVALLVVLFVGCNPVNEDSTEQITETTGSLFIIGGGSRPEAMVNRMIDEANLRNGGYVAILPMSSSVPDSAIIWSSEQFLLNGITSVAGFNFEQDTEHNQMWIDSLKNASLIYISGGDQSRFMAIVEGTPIETAIHEAFDKGAVIAGTSAGAAVMSEKMITGNELRNPDYTETFRTIEGQNLELKNGLGLLKTAIIDQHFIWRSRHNRLITAVIEHPELIGIGIDESTAILVKGNTAEVVGDSQVMVFSNPERSAIEKDYKLAARNLKIDLYLQGDTFKLTNP